MSSLHRNDLPEIVSIFLTARTADFRYSSFDYCYNYFNPFLNTKRKKDLEKSCLMLGFYLASWGMYRGSAFLLQKSIKHLTSTTEYIESQNNDLWEIDVNNYSNKNVQSLIKIHNELKEKIGGDKKASVTLVTKIMLGVFGCIPAFDRYFCNTFRIVFQNRCGFRAVNEDSLKCLADFYKENKKEIDGVAQNAFTLNFFTDEQTSLHYTKAKIIDMYGFNRGLLDSSTVNVME